MGNKLGQKMRQWEPSKSGWYVQVSQEEEGGLGEALPIIKRKRERENVGGRNT